MNPLVRGFRNAEERSKRAAVETKQRLVNIRLFVDIEI